VRAYRGACDVTTLVRQDGLAYAHVHVDEDLIKLSGGGGGGGVSRKYMMFMMCRERWAVKLAMYATNYLYHYPPGRPR
jgi:hypothetical protein